MYLNIEFTKLERKDIVIAIVTWEQFSNVARGSFQPGSQSTYSRSGCHRRHGVCWVGQWWHRDDAITVIIPATRSANSVLCLLTSICLKQRAWFNYISVSWRFADVVEVFLNSEHIFRSFSFQFVSLKRIEILNYCVQSIISIRAAIPLFFTHYVYFKNY